MCAILPLVLAIFLAIVLAVLGTGCKAADEAGCRVQRGGNYGTCMYLTNKDHEEDRRHDDVDDPACQRGDQMSCLRAAQYEKARAFGFDYQRKFERACQTNIAEACFEAGRGQLGPPDRSRGVQLVYRSCEMGFRRACEDGPAMADAGPERARFLALACHHNVVAACPRP